MITTIQVDSNLKQKLDSLKVHHRETYNELLLRLIDDCSSMSTEKESLVATLEVMSDPECMRNIADAVEDMDDLNNKSKWVPLEKVKKDLRLNV